LHIPLKINTFYGTTQRARNYNGDALAEFMNRPASCLNSAIAKFYPKSGKAIKINLNLALMAALNIIRGCEN
jgi:hypothetical protein